MAYDPAKRHHWQMNTVVRPAADASVAEVVAVCELCGTVRRYDLANKSEQMIIGGTCPGTSPEPKA
jgi:hypothetical protein